MCDTPSIILLSEDADQKAIDDLSRQLKQQSGEIAQLTKAKIKELKTLVKAEKSMKSVLEKSRGRFLKTLGDAVKVTDPLSLLALPRDQMIDFIIRGGFDISIDEFIEQTDNIAKAVENTAKVIQPDLGLTPIQQKIDLMQAVTVQQVFDDVVLPTVANGTRDSLNAMTLDVPPKDALSTLAQRMNQATGKQLTEINTKSSMFGRSVTAQIAEEAGLNLFLYTGPLDGVTRKFCDPLVDKVVSDSQMRKLNNGQGLPVRTAGGGYNCRHSWSPVSKGFVKAANLTRATTRDISDANTGGKRK
jgi:hypothetical protein